MIAIKANQEARRLDSVVRLGLLDTPAEERFDRIVRLAARVFAAPVALFSLVDADRQWFKAGYGLARRETPRKDSFCAHAIEGTGPIVVPDARVDPRFSKNPLVTAEPGIRFYAGHPVRGPKGLPVGALGIIDARPRTLSDQDLANLADFASLLEGELRVSRMSWAQQELLNGSRPDERRRMVDSATRGWSVGAILEVLAREMSQAARTLNPLAAAVIRLDPHAVGPREEGEALHEVAGILRATLRPYDAVGRIGDREFLVVLPGADLARAASSIEEARSAVESGAGGHRIACGVAAWDSDPESAAGLFERAHLALGKALAHGGNCVRMAREKAKAASPGL